MPGNDKTSYIHFTPEADIDLDLDPDTKDQRGYVILKNISNAGVGFKFRSSNKQDVTVEPARGVLGPSEEKKATVSYMNWHPDHSAHERLQVLVAPLDDLYHSDQNLHELFQRAGKDDVQSHSLQVRPGTKKEPVSPSHASPNSPVTKKDRLSSTTSPKRVIAGKEQKPVGSPSPKPDSRRANTAPMFFQPGAASTPYSLQPEPPVEFNPPASSTHYLVGDLQVPAESEFYSTTASTPYYLQPRDVSLRPMTHNTYPDPRERYQYRSGTPRPQTQRGYSHQVPVGTPVSYGAYHDRNDTVRRRTQDRSGAHPGSGYYTGSGYYIDERGQSVPFITEEDRRYSSQYQDTSRDWGHDEYMMREGRFVRGVPTPEDISVSLKFRIKHKIDIWLDRIKQHRLVYPCYSFLQLRPYLKWLILLVIVVLLLFAIGYPLWKRSHRHKLIDEVSVFGGSAVAATAAAVAEIGETIIEDRKHMTLDEFIHWMMG